MTDRDIDRIADKILEKMRNDKEIKAEKQLTPFQKTEKVLFCREGPVAGRQRRLSKHC